MQGRWLGVMLLPVLLSANQVCIAGECAGKLQRVDWKTVTLRSNDKPIVLKVDPDVRKKAAAYLGKSVTVSFESESGQGKALLFRSCR